MFVGLSAGTLRTDLITPNTSDLSWIFTCTKVRADESAG